MQMITPRSMLAVAALTLGLTSASCAPLSAAGNPVAPPPASTGVAPTPAPQVNHTHAGFITQDEIWRGHHFVSGDIWVRPGVTLTIDPGTVVTIAANRDEHNLFYETSDLRTGINAGWPLNGVRTGEPFRDEAHHISLRIDGRLMAQGDATLETTAPDGSLVEAPPVPITITSDNPHPTPYDWNRLIVTRGRIAFTLIEYYRILETRTNDVEISFSILRHVGECAVCAYSDARLSANIIFDAGHALIEVAGSPVITDSMLAPNAPPRDCIHILRGKPILLNNELDSRCR